MSALTNEFLESIGINLNQETFVEFSSHFDETLKERILSDIIDELSDDQLIEFEQLKDVDGDHVWHWIQNNVKDLKDIIQEEVDILLGELAENSDQINESTS